MVVPPGPEKKAAGSLYSFLPAYPASDANGDEPGSCPRDRMEGNSDIMGWSDAAGNRTGVVRVPRTSGDTGRVRCLQLTSDSIGVTALPPSMVVIVPARLYPVK